MQLKDNMLIPGVTIKSVAVWDTVGSLGIPNYASGARMDLFRFTDTALSDRIENGLHAMAIDELRVDFPITRWDERKGVRQVWFAGAHSDVGGGYPPAECGLSDLGLGWMMKRLEELGVKFDSKLEFDPQTGGLQMNVHTPWKDPPFNLTKQVPRQVLASDEVDESVIQRLDSMATYRPDALAAWAKARRPT
jgi:glutathione S-transferase